MNGRQISDQQMGERRISNQQISSQQINDQDMGARKAGDNTKIDNSKADNPTDINLAQSDALRRDFTSNVTHDMKTPLHVISGYAELMRDGLTDPEDVQKFASVIYDEAQRLSRLVDDVLTLSLLDSQDVDTFVSEPCDLSAIAAAVFERLEFVAKRAGVDIAFSAPTHEVFVKGSPKLLDEAIMNLVDNAIRYSKRNKCDKHNKRNKHADSLDATYEAPYVRLAIKELGTFESDEAKFAQISVEDNGIGIAKDDQERVFNRFWRVEESRSTKTGGTGLGLAIVKHVAQVHGARVDLESAPDEGSKFTITLDMV